MTELNPAKAVEELNALVSSLVALGHRDIIRAAEANLEPLIAAALSRNGQNCEVAAHDRP
jgi:hypothetical protein